MTMATGTPFFLMPFRMTCLSSASVQLPIPVSLSCVMLGAVTLNGGSSHDRPPENALSMMSPSRPLRGVAVAAGQDSVDQIVAALDQVAARGLRIGGASRRDAKRNCEEYRTKCHDVPPRGQSATIITAGHEPANKKGGNAAALSQNRIKKISAAAVAVSSAFFSCTGPESWPLASTSRSTNSITATRGIVAIAEARLQHAGIAAVALLVARAEHVEELLDHGDVADLARSPGGAHAGRRACRA